MKTAKINVDCKITFIQDLTDVEALDTEKILNAIDFNKKLESSLKECLEKGISDKVIIDIKEVHKEISESEECLQ